MEVKCVIDPPTAIAELVHEYQYILCQNFTLEPSKLYELNFTVYNQPNMIYTKIIVLVNDASFFNHTTMN